MAKDTFFVQSGSLYIIQGDNFVPSSSISFSIEDPVTDLDSSDGMFASGSVNAGITRSHIITSFHPELSASGTFEIDPDDPNSFYMSGSSPNASFYLSSSGRMGLGTTDPLADVDIRATEFQIQKQGVRQGVKVNKEGNLESFNAETSAAATGSEFILSYTRGGTSLITSENLQLILGVDSNEIDRVGGATIFFNEVLKPKDQDKILFLLENPEKAGLSEKFLSSANVGDILGSIRWIAKSGSEDTVDQRTAGEAATIQAVVNASSQFGTSADLLFKVADRTALEGASEDLGQAAAPKVALRLDGSYQHQLTGSLSMTSDLYISSRIYHLGDTDTFIAFTNDAINVTAGGETMMQFVNHTQDKVLIGDGGDIDFRVAVVGSGGVSGATPALFVEGSSGEVGIGTSTPGEKLEVIGNISASGTIIALSSNIVTINGGSF